MRIVCISDTHMKISKIKLPAGDILLHAGDHSFLGDVREMSLAFKELKEAAKDFKYIIATAGNHDFLAEQSPSLMESIAKTYGITYLHDSSTIVEGKTIYCSGWTPEFCDWALNVPRGEKLREKWALIPDKVDILVTHGPPMGILDMTPRGERVGCEELLIRVKQVKPELHVFGHIHHSYGMHLEDGITFVNAASCDERYLPINPPIVVELE